jgi:thioredoxin-related protein
MDEILSHEEIRRVSILFHCFKCNAKELSDNLKKTYKIKTVPKVLFFDVKGKKSWQLTSTKAKPKSIAKKMKAIAANFKKRADKARKQGKEKNQGG